ncbi:hypothetical protein GCM10010954_10810 [Halobacillus andaensis]|uniref:N-acetyltransferase domain-containing protein n=2 Tax=Halobacillus andaensis TaxID=1176239 RepID=A0A917B084_HALAA|nr:putative N-acetyltransferase YhbS [Halobacillus andaensis]GGF13912.1 hypothetical protein GCM10010954_10810 [Halobacillus andaensis]
MIESSARANPSLALAPMAVHPPVQKKGIGSLLVREGLLEAQELGFTSAVVLGHSDFYPRFGFTQAKDKGIYPPSQVPEEAYMVKELQTGALKGVSGTVRYPAPFLS